jgi:hypothetical protein
MKINQEMIEVIKEVVQEQNNILEEDIMKILDYAANQSTSQTDLMVYIQNLVTSVLNKGEER